VAEPLLNRTMMCYKYNGGDLDQALKDACGWRMLAADMVGLTELSYGVDYLRGRDSVDINTGKAFRGEQQYVKGLQGLSKFCGTVAAGTKLTMACGKAVAATGTASKIDDAAGTAKGSLRKRMGNPPPRMKKPQAHHDLARKFRKDFEGVGFDINDPRYGRWVEGGPVGGHQKWSYEFNQEWKNFFGEFSDKLPSKKQILENMNRLRKNPRFQ